MYLRVSASRACASHSKAYHCYQRFSFTSAGYQDLTSHRQAWRGTRFLKAVFNLHPLLPRYGLIRHFFSGCLHFPLSGSSLCHPEAQVDATSSKEGFAQGWCQPRGERNPSPEPGGPGAFNMKLSAWWHPGPEDAAEPKNCSSGTCLMQSHCHQAPTAS